MKFIAATLLALGMSTPAPAQGQTSTPTLADLESVSPALSRYTQQGLLGSVWQRAGLTPRERSIVTLSIMIGRGQTAELPFHLDLALENGVKPAEISEIVTHLAFYSGWANATAAVPFVKQAFAGRKIGTDQLPSATPKQLPLNETAEAARVKLVDENFGTISPGLAKDTTDFLFRDLWLRPDLAPRDRSLVTISSLLANGQSAQLGAHMNIGMNNGLTREEIGEIISHSGFYAGWPHAFGAMGVAKSVFEARK